MGSASAVLINCVTSGKSLNSLSLRFLICKMKIIMPAPSHRNVAKNSSRENFYKGLGMWFIDL